MLTIDESMIRFNGRSNFKVYMPLKPTKYGFKAYVLAEASTGFVLSWELHDGRNTSLLNILDSLTSAFANQGYRISMGGFYTTLTIVEHLTNNGFEVLGTITSNRAKLSQEIKDKSQKLKKGESNFYCSSSNKILLTVWRDSKVVYLASNISNNEINEVYRNSKSNDKNLVYEKEKLDCPNNIRKYAQSSRGVDYLTR